MGHLARYVLRRAGLATAQDAFFHAFASVKMRGLLLVTLVWTAPHLQVPNGARVSSLSLNRKDSLLLANCHDRTIRMFELQPAPQGVEGVDEVHVATVLQSTGKVGGGGRVKDR